MTSIASVPSRLAHARAIASRASYASGSDLVHCSVVRVADEIVDLMAKACGIDYAEASQDPVLIPFSGVLVPVASPRTLIRTKNTIRPSDAAECGNRLGFAVEPLAEG
jgi:hypothetical protein